MEIRRPFWVLLFILAASGFGAFYTKEITLFRIFYFSALLVIISWFWARFSLRWLEFHREPHTNRQQVGTNFIEKFEITNLSILFRLWLVVEDQSNLPGNNGSRVLSWIGGRQMRMYFSRTYLQVRGSFTLGPTIFKSGDPFGMFAVKAFFPAEKNLLVFPHFVEIDNFPSPAGLLTGGRALPARTLEVTPYAAGVREYMPGDPLSRIHWKTTARRERLMVKEFEQDPQANVFIMLDAARMVQASQPYDLLEETNNSGRFWFWSKHREVSLPPDTFEYGVSIAASLGSYYIKQAKAVGFACAGEKLTVLPPERGERQLSKILETLAFVKADGSLPLLGLVQGEAGNLPRGSIAVLITSSAQEDIAAAADVLVRRDIRPVVVLLAAETFGGSTRIDALVDLLAARRIPLVLVRYGDDLKNTLEKGVGI